MEGNLCEGLGSRPVEVTQDSVRIDACMSGHTPVSQIWNLEKLLQLSLGHFGSGEKPWV